MLGTSLALFADLGACHAKSQVLRFAFYPRPPGGGRPHLFQSLRYRLIISIHALRVEGDPALFRLPISFPNFYPRPPDGGRPRLFDIYIIHLQLYNVKCFFKSFEKFLIFFAS